MSGGVKSPLTGLMNTVLESEIDAPDLVALYANKFNVDISSIMGRLETLSLYRCLDSGYRFYYPYSAAGDDRFYRHFGRLEWYYLPWKWEHEKCLAFIETGSRVLEVGAGKGDFLAQLRLLKGVDCVGLELNGEAVAEGRAKGVDLIQQSVEDHSRACSSCYDVVCAYQVLEHVPNVRSFFHAMIHCLKPGGILIISVPNNDSFISRVSLPSRILNLPPHHMGLWNESSLKSIQYFFSLKFIESLKEPLQNIHADTYQHTLVRKILFNSALLTKIFWKMRLHLLVRPFIRFFASHITGHSIMVVYRKTDEKA